MKSTVLKLYDRRQITIPKDMVKWRISDEEVEQQLVVLSRTYGKESEAEQVEKGDSVRLSCEEGALRGRIILLYPGLNMPGAVEAESAVLGRKVKERIVTAINGDSVTLTVEEIIRRTPADINDELVKNVHEEGVNTLDDYRRAYRERTEEQNRQQAKKRISFFVMEEIARHSEYALDNEELENWKDEAARDEFQVCLEDGEDPRLPEDGGEPLTDEQAIEKIKNELDLETHFKMELVYSALCDAEGIPLDWDNLNEEFEKMIPPEMAELLSEEDMEQSKADFMKNAALTKAYDLLMEEASAYLED